MKTRHPNQPARAREGAPDAERNDEDRALLDEAGESTTTTPARGRRKSAVIQDATDQDDTDHLGDADVTQRPAGDTQAPDGETYVRDGDGLPVSAPKK